MILFALTASSKSAEAKVFLARTPELSETAQADVCWQMGTDIAGRGDREALDESIRILREALHSRRWKVADRCIRQLRIANGVGAHDRWSALSALASCPDGPRCDGGAALWLYARYTEGDQSVLPALRDASAHGNASVRAALAEICAEIGDCR